MGYHACCRQIDPLCLQVRHHLCACFELDYLFLVALILRFCLYVVQRLDLPAKHDALFSQLGSLRCQLDLILDQFERMVDLLRRFSRVLLRLLMLSKL